MSLVFYDFLKKRYFLYEPSKIEEFEAVVSVGNLAIELRSLNQELLLWEKEAIQGMNYSGLITTSGIEETALRAESLLINNHGRYQLLQPDLSRI